jgi:peptide deformylase
MTQREILIYPQHAKALRRPSEAVTTFNQNLSDLTADLEHTLAAHPEGIGLAAPQINVHQRVVIVRLGLSGQPAERRQPPLALVNPVILEATEPRRDFDGCLSFPGLYGQTSRPHNLLVAYHDQAGGRLNRRFMGFDAVLVHHEIDHLNGVLFIDHIDRPEDLFRIEEDEFGYPVRIPAASCSSTKEPQTSIDYLPGKDSAA